MKLINVDTVIVAPWGNPHGWREVYYTVELSVDGERYEKIPHTLQSSLGALFKIYEDARGLILASSTLAILYNNRTPIPSSYKEIIDYSRNYIQKYIKNRKYIPDPEKVELAILPGIGIFRKDDKRWVFRGGLGSYTTSVYLSTLRFLEAHRPHRVILDLSHGINYMPALAREAVQLAIASYSAYYDEGIQLLVYNSDPVLEDGAEPWIHLIEERQIIRENAAKWISYMVSNINENAKGIRIVASTKEKKWQLGIKYKQLRKQFGETVKSAKNVLRAINDGFILYLVQCLREDLEKIYRFTSTLEEIIEIGLRGRETEVLLNDREVTVNYNINVELEVAYLHAIARMLSHIKLNDEGCKISLNQLKHIVKKYRFSPAIRIIAEHELSNLEQRVMVYVRHKSLERFEPYYFIYDSTKIEGGKVKYIKDAKPKQTPVDLRNFLAHAGLEKNLVEICFKEKEIWLRYASCAKVRSVLQKLAKQ